MCLYFFLYFDFNNMSDDIFDNFLKDCEKKYEEDREDSINRIVSGMLDGYITLDNPSPINGMDTFKQVVLFQLGDVEESEYRSFSLDIVNLFQERYENLEKGGTDCVIEPIYDLSEIEKESKKLISKLAKSVLRERVTDDNPSKFNNLTSLEQMIFIFFDCSNEIEMLIVKNKILARVLDSLLRINS